MRLGSSLILVVGSVSYDIAMVYRTDLQELRTEVIRMSKDLNRMSAKERATATVVAK